MRKIILNMNYNNINLDQYSGRDVEVIVIEEKQPHVFHVEFPCGYKTNCNGPDRGHIIAIGEERLPLWKESNTTDEFDSMLKNERQFLFENEGETNHNGAYLYKSDNGNEQLLLDFYLRDYKDWLIENNIVKLVD